MEPEPEIVEKWKAEILNPYCISGCRSNCCTSLQPNNMTSGEILVLFGEDDPSVIKRLVEEKKVFMDIKPLNFSRLYSLRERYQV
jgi:hypothetical protein